MLIAFHPNGFEPRVFADAGQVRWVGRSHLYAIYRHLRFFAGEDREFGLARDRRARFERGRAAFERLASAARDAGQRVLLAQVSCWVGYDQAEMAALFAHARAAGVATLLLDPPFCRRLDANSIPDDGHPTAEGHRLLAQRLLPQVRALALRSPADGRDF